MIVSRLVQHNEARLHVAAQFMTSWGLLVFHHVSWAAARLVAKGWSCAEIVSYHLHCARRTLKLHGVLLHNCYTDSTATTQLLNPPLISNCTPVMLIHAPAYAGL